MTNIDLGALVLGGGPFGWTADESASLRILDAYVEAGGTAIDTADSYSIWVEGHDGGESERIIGRWLARRSKRDDVVLCTKVSGNPEHPGLGGDNIRAAVDASLRRLQTDYVDVYYAHQDDPAVPAEEYMAAFDDLVNAGKVREIGASNFTPERLVEVQQIATQENLTPFTISQDEYNLIERTFETTRLQTLRDLGIVEVPYQALATGFLTGKYRPGIKADTGRHGFVRPYLDEPWAPRLLDALDEIAADRHVTVTAVSIAWLRQQEQVAAPITSARTVEQLPALLESTTLTLEPAEIDRLSTITAP